MSDTYHVHGLLQIDICFDIEADSEEAAIAAVIAALKQTTIEANDLADKEEPVVFRIPENGELNEVITQVGMGEEIEEEDISDDDDTEKRMMH